MFIPEVTNQLANKSRIIVCMLTHYPNHCIFTFILNTGQLWLVTLQNFSCMSLPLRSVTFGSWLEDGDWVLGIKNWHFGSSVLTFRPVPKASENWTPFSIGNMFPRSSARAWVTNSILSSSKLTYIQECPWILYQHRPQIARKGISDILLFVSSRFTRYIFFHRYISGQWNKPKYNKIQI